MNLFSILAIAAVAVSSAGKCLYLVPIHQILYRLIPCFVLILFSSSFFALACLIHHNIYIAESAFATTIAATDADDVAIMSIESEGNFNQAMAMGNMLRGAAGVVSLPNNKDSFNEVEASQDVCIPSFRYCGTDAKLNPPGFTKECCEYK
jgi:hypothetical protein